MMVVMMMISMILMMMIMMMMYSFAIFEFPTLLILKKYQIFQLAKNERRRDQ